MRLRSGFSAIISIIFTFHSIPIRVFLLPVPAVPAHVINIVFRMPAQLTVGLGSIRIADGNIAGAAGLDDVRNGDAAGLFKGVDQIQHAAAAAGA